MDRPRERPWPERARRRGKRVPVYALAMLLLYAAAGAAQGLSEMEVKAAYLFNFAKFVEWPPGAFAASHAPLVLCIPGRSALGGALAALEGKSAQGHELRTRREVRPDDLKSCHILFVPEADSASAAELLRKAGTLPVLTVGEQDQFAARGGVIGLVAGDERVRFEINPDAANRAGLKISSQLLRLATLVQEGKNPK